MGKSYYATLAAGSNTTIKTGYGTLKSITVTPAAFSDHYAGNGSTRFVLESAYWDWKDRYLQTFQAYIG